MKKNLILLSLLFVTVCYAAPPPGPDLSFTNDVTIVAKNPTHQFSDFESNQEFISAFEFSENRYVLLNTFPTKQGSNFTCITAGIDSEIHTKKSYKEPPDFRKFSIFSNYYPNRYTDKQHSNFGYPLSAFRH